MFEIRKSEILLILFVNTELTHRSVLIALTPDRGAPVGLGCLFSSIRIALTLHGTKSNSVLSLNEFSGEAVRLDCIWGMLIYPESGSGDVVIKDSISQRSVWCDHILLLTDGVSLTCALWQWKAVTSGGIETHKHGIEDQAAASD